MDLHNLSKFESVPKIYIGREIFNTLFPAKIFLPILLTTNLRTLDCTLICYSFMLISSPF